MSTSAISPIHQTECLRVVPDVYGVFPARLGLLCELNTDSENSFHFPSGQRSTLQRRDCIVLYHTEL